MSQQPLRGLKVQGLVAMSLAIALTGLRALILKR